MSMNSIRKLNSSGLKLKSSFSAKTVAKNITSNRSGATTMLQSSNYAGSGNALFTKSNPIGRQPKYMTSGQLSSWANRGRGQNFSYGGPVTGGSVVYTQQASGSNSLNSFAQFLGTAAALAPGLMQMFGSSGSSNSSGVSSVSGQNQRTSAGDNLLNQANLSNTTISSGSGDVQTLLNNMQTAGSQDSVTLRGAIAQANAKLSEMQAMTPEIQAEAQYADNTLKPEAAKMVADAGKEVDQAKGAVSDANAGVTSAETGVDKAKSTLSQAMKDKGIKNDKYIDARSNLVTAKQNTTDAKSKHTQAKQNTADATNKHEQAEQRKTTAINRHSQAKQATATARNELSTAEQTLSSTPQTKDDGNGHQVPNEPAYSNAKRAVEQAKLKLQQAQQNQNAAAKEEEQAKIEEEQAKIKLEQAQQREKEAKTAEDKAVAAEDKAVKAESDAKAKLSDAEKQVVADENAFKKEEEGLKTAQQTLNTAKTNQEKSQDQLQLAQEKEKSIKEYAKKINDTAGKLQTHLKDVQTLQNGINEANKQLQKLQEQEAKEKADVDNQMGKNDKRNAKLDKKYNFFDDQTSKKEMKAWNERSANQAQNQRLGQQSQRLGSNIQQSTDYTNLASGTYAGRTEFTSSGHTYIADESKGIYMRDGIPTTQADYDKAKLAYHAQHNQR